MQVIFEGSLTYEVLLVDVLKRVLELGHSGQTVLQLADPMSNARGDILIENCKIIFGAQAYQPEISGYSALRSICSFVLADYRLVQLETDYLNQVANPLKLDIERVLRYIPTLPEDQSLLGDMPDSPASALPDPALIEGSSNKAIAPVVGESFANLIGELEIAAKPEIPGGWKPVEGIKVEGWTTREMRAANERDRSSVKDLQQLVQADRSSLAESLVNLENLESSENIEGSANSENTANTERTKIKFRSSNLFKSPKTFLLSCFSLSRLFLPKALLALASIYFIVQCGLFLFQNYPKDRYSKDWSPKNRYLRNSWPNQNAKIFAPSSQSQPAHVVLRIPPNPDVHQEPQESKKHETVSQKILKEPLIKEPLIKEPVKIEPKILINRRERNRRSPNSNEFRQVQLRAKPESRIEIAPKPSAVVEPIPEYKGPSTLLGEPVKHRHAYQTLPAAE